MRLNEITDTWASAPLLIRIIASKFDAGVPIYYKRQAAPGIGRPLTYSLNQMSRVMDDPRAVLSFATEHGSNVTLVITDEYAEGPNTDGTYWVLEPSMIPHEGGFELKREKV